MRSILSDIEQAARGVPIRQADPVREARSAVQSVLQLLIATRRGTVWPARTFGIQDPTGLFLDYPGAVETFCRDLERSIREHEPRLREPAVRNVPGSDLLLRLEIEGTLVTGARRLPVRFTSRIDETWNAEVI